ncbi:MAG: hypothetical protein ACOVO7_14330, partial [Microcystis aeruginosa]
LNYSNANAKSIGFGYSRSGSPSVVRNLRLSLGTYLKCRMNAPAKFFDKTSTFAGDEIRPEYQPQSIGLILPSMGKLCYN